MSQLDQTAQCFILDIKYYGVMHPKNQEAWEAELLLVASATGADNTLELTPMTKVRWFDKNNLEPGTVKYYLIPLRKRDKPRTCGPSPINPEHFKTARSFDIETDAIEAFKHARA